MSLTERVSFLIKHCVVHVFFYLVPRVLHTVLVRWPARLLHCLAGSKAVTPPTDERAIMVIASATDPRVQQSFGLTEKLRYTGPLYNGHIHTILGNTRVTPRVQYTRELVLAFGGQHINADYLLPSQPQRAKALLVVIPGLLNSSTTAYVSHFAATAARAGYAVCVLNYRGMGSTPLEVPRLFSATFTDDIRYCVEHYLTPTRVQARLGTAAPVPLVGVGFSLGGVVLIKYVSEQGLAAEKQAGGAQPAAAHPTPLDAVVTVTSPYDLVKADDQAVTWAYRNLYEKPFAVGLRKYMKHNHTMLMQLDHINTEAVFGGPHPLSQKFNSIKLFDQHVNAPHNGFATPLEYYRAGNSLPWLRHTRTPVLCISDANDPVCGSPVDNAEWRALVAANPSTVYACLPVGGHLGFLGSPLAEWQDQPNEGERFVLRSIDNFCAAFNKRK